MNKQSNLYVESASEISKLLISCKDSDVFNESVSRILGNLQCRSTMNPHKTTKLHAGISLPEEDPSNGMQARRKIDGFQPVLVNHDNDICKLDQPVKTTVPYLPLGRLVMGSFTVNGEEEFGVVIVHASSNNCEHGTEGSFVPKSHVPQIFVGTLTTL